MIRNIRLNWFCLTVLVPILTVLAATSTTFGQRLTSAERTVAVGIAEGVISSADLTRPQQARLGSAAFRIAFRRSQGFTGLLDAFDAFFDSAPGSPEREEAFLAIDEASDIQSELFNRLDFIGEQILFERPRPARSRFTTRELVRRVNSANARNRSALRASLRADGRRSTEPFAVIATQTSVRDVADLATFNTLAFDPAVALDASTAGGIASLFGMLEGAITSLGADPLGFSLPDPDAPRTLIIAARSSRRVARFLVDTLGVAPTL